MKKFKKSFLETYVSDVGTVDKAVEKFIEDHKTWLTITQEENKLKIFSKKR